MFLSLRFLQIIAIKLLFTCLACNIVLNHICCKTNLIFVTDIGSRIGKVLELVEVEVEEVKSLICKLLFTNIEIQKRNT